VREGRPDLLRILRATIEPATEASSPRPLLLDTLTSLEHFHNDWS
jgi:hypothetical protein